MAKRFHGSVFRVPEQKPGGIANCSSCDWSRFFPKNKRKRGSAFSRASRALDSHVRLIHPRKIWVPE